MKKRNDEIKFFFRDEVNNFEEVNKVYYKTDSADCCPGDNFSGMAGMADE